jgi:N-acetyl-anhydromuramyl-L-alanine amidase AmpD
VYRSVQIWRRLFQTLGVAALSVLLMVIAKMQDTDRKPAEPEALPANPNPTQAVLPKPTQILPQTAALVKLYQTAPNFTVEQLTTSESANSEDSLYLPMGLSQDPAQYRMKADPSNFGNRQARDRHGKPLNNRLLIVLHETTSTASAAVNAVQTPHAKDLDQISYHAVIRQDGTILYLVDPRKRAYGAGNSRFKSRQGSESVQTNPALKPSVNNFAYHISLETPSDGYNDKPEHSGYSGAQYSSLAWLIAHSGVESDRITTHAAIDQSGERQDPRSFEQSWLQQDLAIQNVSLSATDTFDTNTP